MTGPDPMTPPECDLRDYPWMPLDCRRLLTSETWMDGPAAGKVAALSLWCEAWCQVPAGSLPDNDRILAHLSQSGALWPKVRDHAMRGWVRCSDGRLYHPVVCEKANEAWALKQAQRRRTEAARKAKQAHRDVRPTDSNSPPVTTSVTDNVTRIVARTVTEHVTGSTLPDHTLQEERPPVRPPIAAADAPPLAAPTRGREGRGIRLPDDWQPSPDDAVFASGLGLDVSASAAEFRDYWHGVPGAKGRKLDWPATWRNRCRERSARQAQRPGQRRETPSEERRRKLGFTSPFDSLNEPVTLDGEVQHVRIN